jgi:hypothetical protein
MEFECRATFDRDCRNRDVILRDELNTIVILPSEIFVVKGVVGVEYFQILSGQFFRFEFSCVDLGMGRRVLGVVGPTVDNRNHVKIQDFEKLFGNIIFAEGVLK